MHRLPWNIPRRRFLALIFLLFAATAVAAASDPPSPRAADQPVAADSSGAPGLSASTTDVGNVKPGQGVTGVSSEISAVERWRRLEVLAEHLDCQALDEAGCEQQRRALARRAQMAKADAEQQGRNADAAPGGNPRAGLDTSRGFGTLRGTVTSAEDDTALAGTHITAWGHNTTYRTVTDGQGRFLLYLTPGTYVVTAEPAVGPYRAELYNDHPCPFLACDLSVGDPIEVTDASVDEGIDFALEPAGAITGTVRDSTTGTGIPYVGVILYDENVSSLDSTFADYKGLYDFGALPDGDYHLLALGEDLYVPELYDDKPCVSGECDVLTGDAVTALAGTTTFGIDFALQEGSGVTGKVHKSDGSPIPNVTVLLWESVGTLPLVDSTDSGGNYAISAENGTYTATVVTYGEYQDELYDDIYCPWGRYCELDAGTPLTVSSDGERNIISGIDFELEPAGTIEGVVSTDGPHVSTVIKAWNIEGELVTSINSRSLDGSYSLQGFASGTYFVTADSVGVYRGGLYEDLPCPGDVCDPRLGTPIVLTAPETIAGIDFELQPGPGIRGRLSDGQGNPISSVRVYFRNESDNLVASAFSDSEGHYSSTLPPGTFFVSTYDHQRNWADELYDDLPCPRDTCDHTTGTPLKVGKVTVDGIDFELEPTGSITGTVRDLTTKEPLAGISVGIYSEDGSYLAGTSSNSDGNYSIFGLSPEIHFVKASSRGLYRSELWNNIPCEPSCAPTSGTPVDVQPDAETTGIDFDLELGSGVSGRITREETGTGLPNTIIAALDASGSFVAARHGDTEGFYELGLEPGTYYLVAHNAYGYLDELYDNLPCEPLCDVTEGSPITIPQGTNTVISGIDFELAVGGVISGQIKIAPTPRSTERGTITVWDDKGQEVKRINPRLSGTYQIGPLQDGRYTISLRPWSPLLSGQLYEGQACTPQTCCPTAGTVVTVSAGTTTESIDFNIPWVPEVVLIDGFENGNLETWLPPPTP